mmetsp:Transcript_12794/g.36606  ORF Transcript_12794/g.36606 Transcript_12794/m.36606 type:complete len:609 (-) Transcript_12794:160-1986(-)
MIAKVLIVVPSLSHRLGDDRLHLVLDLAQLLLQFLDLGIVSVGLQPADSLGDGVLDRLFLRASQLFTQLLRHLTLGRVQERLQRVLCVDLRLDGAILLGEHLRVGNHLVDVLLRETARVVLDDNLLFISRRLLNSRDREDSVRINLEGNLNLRLSAGHRRNVREVKLTELVVVFGERALSLEHLDGHHRLLISMRGEDLALLGGHHGVPVDELGHDPADGLNSERQGADVQQEDVLDLVAAVTSEDAALDCGTVGDGLIRVDTLVGLLAVEEVLDELLHLGNTRGSADQDDLMDLVLLHVGVLKRTLDGDERLLEQVGVELLETGTGQRLAEVLAVDEGLDLHADLMLGRERPLGALGLAPQLLQRLGFLGDVLVVLLLDELDEVLHDALVKVGSSQVGISGRGHNLKDSRVNRQDRHVERAASQIEHQDVLLLVLLVESVRDGSGSGLIDDPQDVEPGDRSSVLGGLTLRVVEVGRDGDDGVLDLLAQVGLRRLLHLAQYHRRELLRAEGLVLVVHLDLDVRLALVVHHAVGDEVPVALNLLIGVVAADQAFHLVDSPQRVGRGLVLRGVTHQPLVTVPERDVGGRDAGTLVVGQNLHLAIFIDSNA